MGNSWLVMAGLVPAIHAFPCAKQDVDARHKAGHDECSYQSGFRKSSTRSALIERSWS
jgi:hypothetical protein